MRLKTRRNYRQRMTPQCPPVWLEIAARERAELFASPERCAEIEARQPEAESRGRAILYFPEARDKSGAQRKRRKDASRYGMPVQNTDMEVLDAAA